MEELKDYKISEKRTVQRNASGKKEYDVYEVELTFMDGQIKKYKVFTEAGTLDLVKGESPSKQEDLIRWFLVERLLGKGGLIQQQNDSEYIYAGKIEKNRAERYSGNAFGNVDENGKTQKEKFESDLPFIKSAMEKTDAFKDIEVNQYGNLSKDNFDDVEQAKTYVISDIHGMYGSYMEAVSRLKPEDTLYVLGDVIDRGKNGIKILQDIIKRQNDFKKNPDKNPNIIFLCGNHEMIFVENMAILTKAVNDFNQLDGVNIYEADGKIRGQKKYDPLEITRILCEYYELAYPRGIGGPHYSMDEIIERAEKEIDGVAEQIKKEGLISLKKLELMIQQMNLQKKFNSLVDLKQKYDENITPLALQQHDRRFVIWLINNGAKETALEYTKLSEKEREDILDEIANSYVSYVQKGKDKDYLLIHALPPQSIDEIRKMKAKNYRMVELSEENERGDMKDAGYNVLRFVLEERPAEEEEGYTPEYVEITRKPFRLAQREGLYTICGHNGIDGKIRSHPEAGYTMIDTREGLAFFCLDDESVEYIPDMEDVDRNMEIQGLYDNIQKAVQKGIDFLR